MWMECESGTSSEIWVLLEANGFPASNDRSICCCPSTEKNCPNSGGNKKITELQCSVEDKDDLEVHFNFEALKVFKYPLDREVDEGVRMVMHQVVLLNSKTEWFSPSIVRTTIEKGGAEMAHQPARGFRVPTSIHSSASQPPGRSEGLAQPSRPSLASQPTGRSKGSAPPPKPSMASSKPPASAATG